MRVAELMTRDVVAVRPDTPLHELAQILAACGISGVPVVAEGRRVVGVVSEADVIACANGALRRLRLLSLLTPSGREHLRRRLEARTAADAMSSPAVTVRSPDRVAAAGALMASRGFNRLPVVDEEGRLVGIVTRSDVVRAFARSDAEVEAEIRGLLGRVLSIPPQAVQVRVDGGEATLSGRVETPELEELVVALVRQVPGVLAVEPRLAHEREREPTWPQPRLFVGVG